ncbi:hypothetical protein [Erwinia typographi]|uniref:hypothetical protein n=1 Tax=Erwinia typographi TaxID=371042 RepID=UPI0012ECC2FE|nr:hypothetical protein [Erwinia typographi]
MLSFNYRVYFREFSGGLSHEPGYSFVKVQARRVTDNVGFELNVRIAQRTDDGVFNLAEAHGNSDSPRTLIICCKIQDNDNIAENIGVYHMWVGLETVSDDTGDTDSYVIYSLDVTVSDILVRS